MPRRAKIVCTLGPAVDDEAVLAGLVRAGMNAARLNLSFGELPQHAARIERLRGISARLGEPVAIIADIPGPKVRVGRLRNGACILEEGTTVRLVRVRPDNEAVEGDCVTLPVDGRFFHDDMIRGDEILFSDGLVELEVAKVEPDAVEAVVRTGGEVCQRTGVHQPAVFQREGPVTAADEAHIRFAVEHEVDFIGLTYVRDGADIIEVRELLEGMGRPIPLIAKIERPEAFARLDGILARADAVMIRRGDLGATIELTRVPLVQKEIVRLATARGVPVIIATQMLSSMIDSPRPTRAEASDVSNAIVDGADGVLLSSETAVGRHPLAAVEMMDRIICETEKEQAAAGKRLRVQAETEADFPDTAASMACRAALQANASLIACFTESGLTAGRVAKYRPHVPIIALCDNPDTERRLAIRWGVRCLALEPVHDAEKMVHLVDERLLAFDLVKRGDSVVIVFGAPIGEMGHTNSVRLHRVATRD